MTDPEKPKARAPTRILPKWVGRVIIGGAVLGTLVGVLILGVLANGLILVDVGPSWQIAIKGLFLIGAVALSGVLLTMVDGRTRLSADVSAELERHFGTLLFRARVPRSVRIAEAPSHGQPIITYDPRSAGAEAYWKVAMELVDRP